MRKLYFLLIVFSALFYFGCSDNSTDPDLGKGFSIYFLRDPNIKIGDIINKDINSFGLNAAPWIYEYDIDFYDFSSHCIYLKKDKSYFVPNVNLLSEYKEYNDKPFVIVCDKKRCCLGYFYNISSSLAGYRLIQLNAVDFASYPIDILHINWIFSDSGYSTKETKIRNSLISSNLYHGGLEVKILNIKVYKGDTAALEYKISIKNNDSDNLLFFDPDKTGSELFHYFSWGPCLYNPVNKKSFAPVYKKVKQPDPFDKWEPGWFTKIESGRTIERTVILKGYQNIPNGTYSCQFQYEGPKKIEKAARKISEGRYWIGPTPSITVSLDLKNE